MSVAGRLAPAGPTLVFAFAIGGFLMGLLVHDLDDSEVRFFLRDPE